MEQYALINIWEIKVNKYKALQNLVYDLDSKDL